MNLTEPTLNSQIVQRPEPTEEYLQNLCLDKCYDYDEVREIVGSWQYIAHIRTRGEEAQEKRDIPG